MSTLHIPAQWQEALSNLPPYPNRKDVATASGGLFSHRTLANWDCEGKGIQGRKRIGKRTVYPRDEAIRFILKYAEEV